ncbi:transcriptional regulator [Streptomyces microflavus]|uniref:transcriptional regulator n=1 Tax=Streptomyces microflavus TaxID=1919 RepID=UPI002257F85F|nr:transcriptional regulator [Streptomyces microflavus]MCX4657410.1 transcriptional regulator [Streptomyces microflavus]
MANGRWGTFSHYGAQGVTGGDALGIALGRMVTGISSPVESERGFAARVRYLTKVDAGYEAMDRAGVHVSPRTLMAWLAEERMPRSKAMLARVDAAYWELRRRNLAADLKRRLHNGGRGTRIEINPVNQSGVDPKHQRDLTSRLSTRDVNVRDLDLWDRAVDAWLANDQAELDDVWARICQDRLGTDWEAYEYVDSIGWDA